MEVAVSVGISNRHVHLNEATYNMLFDEPINELKPLHQIGEYVSDKTVTLLANGHIIENVKVLGPLRAYNQIEISHNDAIKFKLNPPVRASGDLENSEYIVVKTPKAMLRIQGCIIAERHVHMTPAQARQLGVENKQALRVRFDGLKNGEIEAFAKVSDSGYFELHIDTDDANAFILNNDDKGTLII